VTIATAASPQQAAATGDVDRVWAAYLERWATTDTYTALFRQTIEIEGIGGDVASAGRFYFAKPDRMRWDYLEGQPQRVVGDGRWIWVYQPDLEQVYRVDYQTAFGSGGLVALLADRKGLARRYDLAIVESSPEKFRLRLTPKNAVGETLDLTLAAGTFDLTSVVIHDPAGSVTHVEFAEVRRNVAVEPALFTFAPPPGVDIITTPQASR
jgi:outer membrane lipoprotein carrier protein